MIDKKNMKERVELNDFGSKLRDFRINQKQKQGEMAKKLGFTRTYINEFEAGKWIPSFNFMARLTEIFNNLEIFLTIKKGKINIDFKEDGK